MKKSLLILFASINVAAGLCQNSPTEKELIKKYSLSGNFFSTSCNSKEYIVTYYDSLSKSNGKNILPPTNLVTEVAKLFLRKKMFDKAYWLFRMNIENYPKNYMLYRQMGDCYNAKGDMDRTFVYYSRALTVKYKQPSVISDSLIKIDTEIVNDYNQLSKITERKILPPQYLVKNIANNLIRLNKTDKAMALFKMNYENYPASFEAIDDMGSYYENMGDSIRAFEYWAKAVSVQYKLPNDFFAESFNPVNYLNAFFSTSSGTPGEKSPPPEQLVNSLGYVFLSGKMFAKAEQLFRLNIENYPKSENVFDSMADYYEAIGNKEKEEEYRKQFEDVKSKKTAVQRSLPVEVIADTTFDAQVVAPVCHVNCPVILFDEAHHNYHTAVGRYKSFARLMENDGFNIIRGESPFTNQVLTQVNVVVIASLGFPSQIPIPVTEIQTLNDWVTNGGSLFVITDHDNLAIDELLHSFGVETQEINVTTDPRHGKPLENGTTNPSNILFTEKDKLLGIHPIILGRKDSEKIKAVQTYAGRTIIGPPASSPLLILSDSATDYMVIDPAQRIITRVPVKTKGLRTHGVAFIFGKGKVVVVGEAAMLTAQMWPPNFTPEQGGLNTPGSDNKQFALNIMRWLTGYLK